MRVNETLHLPLSPDAVSRMYTDPQYPPLRAAALRAHDVTASVTGSPESAFSVSSTLKLPTAGIPDLVRKVVGEMVTVREVQDWSAPAADGSRTGTIELHVEGTPASMTGDLRLAAAGEDASTVTIDGELQAKVPLLGKKIEQAAVPYVKKVLAKEQSSATAYVGRDAE